MTTMNANNQQPILRQLGYVALVTAAILMIPLVAMQFTREVDWSVSDFVIMGILISGIGSAYVFLSRLVQSRQGRIALGLVLGVMLFFTWAELAVGVFGTPFAGS